MHVVCEVAGVAESAALLIAVAADEIRMPEGGFLHLHPAAYVDGRPDDERVEMMNDAMARRFAAKSGRGQAEVLDLLREGKWLGAEEAVSLGFADVVLGDEGCGYD